MERSSQADPTITSGLLIINATTTNWTGISLGHPRSNMILWKNFTALPVRLVEMDPQQLTLKNVHRHNEGLKWAIRADEEGQNHFGLPLWE